MKRLIRKAEKMEPIMAGTVNEPYDEDMWYVRYNEAAEEIEEAYAEGYFSKDEYFSLLTRLENLTPYRPYENLSDNNRLKCSDTLDQLTHDVAQYVGARKKVQTS